MKNTIPISNFVLYDNTQLYKKFYETRRTVYLCNADEHVLLDEDWVPEEKVWQAIYEFEEIEYADFIKKFDKFIKSGVFIMKIDDVYPYCGNYVRCFNDIAIQIKHINHIKFHMEFGHFYISGKNRRYELIQLTEEGIALAKEKHFSTDYELLRTLIFNDEYSQTPQVTTYFKENKKYGNLD